MLKIKAPVQLIEQVYDTILNAICDGTLLPNARITQEGLATQLGVSRQPIVQAIHLLKQQGFIADAGRKGIMVTPIDPDMIVHLFHIRAALDALAAREAARQMREQPDAAVVQAGRLLVQEGVDLQSEGTTAQLISADMRFHQYIYTISGNPMIAQTCQLHWHHIRRTMGLILKTDTHRRFQIWVEHGAIFDAICRADDIAAETLARQHAESAAEWIAHVLRDQQVAAHLMHA